MKMTERCAGFLSLVTRHSSDAKGVANCTESGYNTIEAVSYGRGQKRMGNDSFPSKTAVEKWCARKSEWFLWVDLQVPRRVVPSQKA